MSHDSSYSGPYFGPRIGSLVHAEGLPVGQWRVVALLLGAYRCASWVMPDRVTLESESGLQVTIALSRVIWEGSKSS